jgi:ABC-2 type transport system ATP-binding protein
MHVLEVEKLRKTFVRGFSRTRTEALQDVSFTVNSGEIFGFLGPNGAGKTTTIKILMGLIHPSSGTARVLGAPVGDLNAKLRVGYLPENPYFYDYLSVAELLDMVGRLYGMNRATRRKRGRILIERVGLGHAAKRSLRSFSKGMLQRAGLAQALMGDPDVVVLDEPMSGLDPLGRKEVRELIEELRDAGKTVFFSTHILADATMLCDRVGIIVGGRLRDVGPLGSLLNPRVDRVEIVWSAPEAAASRLRERDGEHEVTSEGTVTRVPDLDTAQTFATAVLEQGGRLLQLTPHRQSLEELFVSEAEAGDTRRSA